MDCDAAQPALLPSEYEAICDYVRQHSNALWRHHQVDALYIAAQTRSRSAFRNLLADENFRRGLALSSLSLSRNLVRYRSAPDVTSSRLQQIERGLLRYFTRTAAKATPFGSFCALFFADVLHRESPAQDVAHPLRITGQVRHQRRRARLNKRLYGLLWAYFQSRTESREFLAISLNQTLQEKAGELRFLALVKGHEVIQRLRRNAAVDLVVEEIRRMPGERLGTIVARLTEHDSIDATPGTAREFIEGLLNIGLIRFQEVVEVQEDEWDKPFAHYLEMMDDDHALRISELLRRVRELLDSYSIAQTDDAERLLREAYQAIDRILVGCGLNPEGMRGPPIYEDATAAAKVTVVSTPRLEHSLAQLVELVALTQPLAYPRVMQPTLKRFYDQEYGDRDSVPFLEFFEDYAKRFSGAQESENGPVAPGYQRAFPNGRDALNPYRLDYVEGLRHAKRRIGELFREKWALNRWAEEINVTSTELKEALDGVLPARSCGSASAFAQIVCGDAGCRVLVPDGHIRVGYGKFFSRFLYLFHPTATARVREANKHLSPCLFAEINDDANFNGNLHPRLVEHDIAYPTRNEHLSESCIAVGNLDVQRHHDEPHGLELIDRTTRKRVQPIDLGFLNPMWRPPLYQLLGLFMPAGAFVLMLPETPTPDKSRTEGGTDRKEMERVECLYRPRMVYADSVVVARRRWTVLATAFPSRAPRESGTEYCIRVNRWAFERGIPNQFYVRVGTPRGGHIGLPSAGPDEDGASAQVPRKMPLKSRPAADHLSVYPSRDARKPQFIDLASPLLINLFERVVTSRGTRSIVIEECYPTPNNLPSVAGDTFVYEIVFQIGMQETRREKYT
jgi:hypothetical protein